MRFLCMAFGVGVALPLFAVDGELWAESVASPEFSVYSTEDAKYSVASSAEIAALPPVSIRAGETATATSCTGAVTVLESPSLVSVLNMGGFWTLANSGQGTAKIGVAWAVNGDAGLTLATASAFGDYAVDSVQPGPDRKVKISDVPPVAYSGDDWVGDVAAAATVVFTSPGGTETELDLTGTGVHSFPLNSSGRWMVALTMADGTTRTAVINVKDGFIIIFR